MLYDEDFCELIETYAASRGKKRNGPTKISNYVEDKDTHSLLTATNGSSSDVDEASVSDSSDSEDECRDEDDVDVSVASKNSASPSDGYQLTAEYLEDEVDISHNVDDLDVSCGEFPGNPSFESSEFHVESNMSAPQESLQQGPTIIYVPTRKETTKIVEYLSRSGVRAEAYNAKLPKAHLRRVHQEFHQNSLEVVVATIAFGMGIEKSNV